MTAPGAPSRRTALHTAYAVRHAPRLRALAAFAVRVGGGIRSCCTAGA
jgi:hypothetical protein